MSSRRRRGAATRALAALAGGVLLAVLPALGRAAIPDYALLDQALLLNVRNGYVDYDGIKADPGFADFVRQLAAPPEGLDGQEATLAYYINAYNALAIQGILDGYSPATKSGRKRYFNGAKFRLAGEQLTLEQIEQQHIRPNGDPRFHFAIVCASISCPRLSSRAFLPETLDAQLDEAARRFVNDATRNRFDIPQKTAFVSEIFARFSDDFGKAAGSLPGYLARYVDEPATRAALTEGRLAIRPLPYDWDLNGSYTGASAE